MRLSKLIVPAVAAVLMAWGCTGTVEDTVYRNVIPLPQEIKTVKGSYTLPSQITVAYTDAALAVAAGQLVSRLDGIAGATALESQSGDIILSLGRTGLGEGGYILEVSEKGVAITSESYPGIISGISTFVQAVSMAHLAGEGSVRLPAAEISDAPYYGWRGIHLDVARHFFTPGEVEELLDWMALYKFNKFHWHLTDDEGWRIELDAYPVLAREGGYRTPDRNDVVLFRRAADEDNPSLLLPRDRTRIEGRDTIYGGYYTKDEIRSVVQYAAERGIDVIPEVDMPGHSMRTLMYYPQFSCFGTVGWGSLFSTPMCPGKDAVLEFCEQVWEEVFELFPYEYVHIGGDEVEKDNWRRCPHCQARMKEYELEDVEQLQAWFIDRMERFFTANGKKMIGWDEMLDGGLSETATVLWWRSWVPDAPARATAQGNNVILVPNEPMYFDYKEDSNTLLRMYNNPIVPDGLTDAQESLILGIQGNLWAEFVPTWERAQYQYFPRLLAVSELGWNSPASKDGDAFAARVVAHYPLLDRMGIKYRMPNFTGIYDKNVFIGEGTVAPELPVPGITVRYTEDGSFPDASSPLYTGPITITSDKTFTFRPFYPDGTPGDITVIPYTATQMREPVTPDGDLQRGLNAAVYLFDGLTGADISTSPFVGNYPVEKVDIPEEAGLPIGIIYTGYIDIPEDGIYTFYLNTDDGSMLYIHGTLVVDNDGMHSLLEKSGQAALARGLHPIEVHYFDPNGGSVELGFIDPGGKRTEADAGWFRR